MPVEYTAAEIGLKYDDIAPWYDRVEFIPEWLVFRRLRRAWFRKAQGDVLEVAVGTGRNLPYYPRDCRITAVDVSDGMLRIARRRATEADLTVEFRQMDAETLMFPDATFDTVTSSLSTCTFPDPVSALKEMKRVCRPNGRVLLLEHGRSSVRPAAWLQDRLAEGHARRIGCHWNREPQEFVQAAGLKIVSSRRSILGVLHAIEATP